MYLKKDTQKQYESDSPTTGITHFAFSNSETNLSLSLKHCKEFIVERTSGSRSSTDGIIEV